MVMDYPSNSHKPKTEKIEPKKVERVIASDVVRRKKPLSKRFLETFVSGDARGVWNSVAFDILIPAAKDMVVDAGQEAIQRSIYGDSSRSRGRASKRGGGDSLLGHFAYNRISSMREPRSRDEPRNVTHRGRATHNFDEIILASRVECEHVIDRLFDLVNRYENATVADLYDLVGVTGNYTDEKWGWTDIRGAGVTRVRNGYLLDLPKPEPLD
jgi:hypothetical protein